MDIIDIGFYGRWQQNPFGRADFDAASLCDKYHADGYQGLKYT